MPISETYSSGDKYQLIFEHAPLGAFHFDQHGIITACNDAFVKIIGSSRDKLLGLDMCKLPNKEIVESVKKTLRGESCLYSGLYVSVTGNKASEVRAHFAPFFDTAGNSQGGVGIVEDISELMHSKETIKTSEENLENLLDNLPGMVYRCTNDKDWTMEFLSSGCMQLTGYSSEEITASDFSGYNALILAEDRDMVWDVVQKAIDSREKFEMEYRIKHKSGEIKWVWERGSATGMNRQGIEIIEGFIADIDKKKRAEMEMAEKQAYFEKLFSASPEGIVILNLEDCIVRANDTFCKMFGYSHEEIFGKAINEIIVPEELKAEGQKLTEGVAVGSIMKRDTKRMRKDGSLIDVSILASPILTDGEVLAVYGIYRDISMQKATEKDLIVAKEKAEESDRLKTAFLNNLSHEVRTPMNAIIGFSLVLNENDKDTEKTEQLTTAILQSSEQLMNIIDAIVNISTIEAGLLDIFEQSTNLEKILNAIVSKYQITAQQKKLKLRLRNLLPADKSTVMLDEYKLIHILNTLIDNTLKFTETGQ